MIDIGILVRLASSASAVLLRNRVTADGKRGRPRDGQRQRAARWRDWRPKLVLTKTANASTASVGERVTYTLPRHQPRPRPGAVAVRLCDVPGRRAGPPPGPGREPSGPQAGCNLGTLRSGHSASRKAVFSVASARRPARLNGASVSTGGTLVALARARIAVRGAPGVTG